VKKGAPSNQFTTGLFQDEVNLTADQTSGLFPGNVYVAWSQYPGFAETNSAVLFSRSTDHGVTFPKPAKVSPVAHGTASFAHLAVGPDSAVYVSYITYPSSSNPSTNLWAAKSTAGGLTFGDPPTWRRSSRSTRVRSAATASLLPSPRSVASEETKNPAICGAFVRLRD
jgi:hypothetical protein